MIKWLANVIFRAMTRDEIVYQDADSFRPERFLKADGALNDDTMDYAFGFGRRYAVLRMDSYKLLYLRAEFALAGPSPRQRYAILSRAQPANSQNDLR